MLYAHDALTVLFAWKNIWYFTMKDHVIYLSFKNLLKLMFEIFQQSNLNFKGRRESALCDLTYLKEGIFMALGMG